MDGVLMRFMVRMGWAFGRVGANFQVIIFEVRDAPKLDSGMTFGVGIKL